ncbi:attractin-like protein 1 [Actinia tenebrosa]|uniref:Attractin-like protein 1 n=1 Tax=Actinia tenebrosa TaxID=6105 RepID=A0A6P8H0Q2_ACTTE|nr:attractin-like protein 1 [Actinia tenebrosa]
MLNLSFLAIFSFIFTLNTLVFVHSSYSKPPSCDSSKGCSCDPGFWGKQCQFCRLRFTSDTGIISDGPKNYFESSKCSWLIETSRSNSTIELDLEQFATECSWDHLYIYGGNSIHAPLLGTLSGLIRDQSILEVAQEPIKRLRINSNTAWLYFYSDANYVLTGFNIKYRVTRDCSSQCNNHGHCGSHGNCICDQGWTGPSCTIASCLMSCLSGVCNNVTRQCEGCNHGFTGPSCNVTLGSGYWTHVPANNQEVMKGRASHAASLIGDWIWVYGGYAMDNTPFNNLIRYHVSQNKWEVVVPNVSSLLPRQRYGHSMIVVNDTIVVFGGIVDKKTVSELWMFDIRTRQWTQVSVSAESDNLIAVSGHTATLVDNKMVVIFGYGPKEGYTQRVQVFDLEKMSWKQYNFSSLLVQATFGHSSAYDPVSGMIYIHGGYRATLSNNAEISSDLYVYMPSKNKWLILPSSGYPRFLHSSVLLGNLLLVFGGNTHNDTSEALKKTRCYSPDLMLFDTRCNTWTNVPLTKSLSSQAARFGHSAVEANGTMYVIGGFQGTMLGDILQYTTGDCSAHVNKTSCLHAYTKYGCVRTIDTHKCIGPLNADLIKANNLEKPACSANPGKCSMHKNCNQCTSSIFQCSWCGKQCINSTDNCSRKKVTEENQCPKSSLIISGLCPDKDKSSGICAHTVCNDYSTCKTCTGNDKCMWCESQRKCVGLNAYVVSFPYGQCHEWTKDKCADVSCEGRKTCQDCHTLPGCGWCDDGSGTGLGQCMPGGDNGPFSPGGKNSSVVSNQCLPKLNKKRWFFIECPACQCNGHSTCDDEQKCKQCLDNTNGSHCQTCAPGYFGDPTNGGKCQACKCNGHGSVCNHETGVCDCRTKGVAGDNCQLCSRQKGFYGNASNGGHCYYNLTSGYLFTFNLNGTTGVSFLNVPKKDDIDVDFKISISGNDALVNITYKTGSSSEQSFKLAKRIGKYEYSFKHDEYNFGGSSKFTFFVYVYGITGNCVVEISFSQLTPFMLLRFFLTFFGCFFSILIITFIAWKIKIRYSNYVMRRQRIVELHQMANRPSSTLKLLLEKDTDFDNNSASQKIPIAVQPFARETVAIATVMIRLPSLSDGITPIGQSGLCLGSVLIDRSHYHMPSLCHVKSSNKKADKRKDEETTRCV